MRVIHASTIWSQRDQAGSGLPSGFRIADDGIHRREGERWHWLCSPLRVLALPRDGHGAGWGLLIEVTDPDGRTHLWPVPARLFASDGSEVIAQLLDLGLQMATDRGSRAAFLALLQRWRPEARALTTARLGWTDDAASAFVLGSGEVIGGAGAEALVFQPEGAVPAAALEMRASGSLEEWRAEVAALCAGNPLLILATSLAFAGPLLEPLGLEGGGLHLRGESSSGKTTALRAAVSVWGAPGFLQTWRATANGLEGVAAACNGSVLALDEIGELAGREAGSAAYMLANGLGKARADRSGRSRPPARWRVPILSTGEVSLADRIAEAGERSHAGQAVRLLDIPADTRAHGAFDALHGASGGAGFADRLKRAAASCYGTAGPAFVAALIKDREAALSTVRAAMEGFRDAAIAEHGLTSGDGQALRASDRLALIAAAGEMATLWGLTGWPEGAARAAAADAFSTWLAGRGGGGPAEAREALRRTRAFISAHGQSRFEIIGDPREDRVVISRAGWRDAGHFYITRDAWAEIHAGADPKRAARHLREAGLLEAGEGRHLTVRMPASAVPGRPRAFKVSAAILAAGGEGDGDA